jgi:hypothetical protein
MNSVLRTEFVGWISMNLVAGDAGKQVPDCPPLIPGRRVVHPATGDHRRDHLRVQIDLERRRNVGPERSDDLVAVIAHV